MSEAVIVCDPKILCGKPTIRGTRISVEHILERLSSGDSIDDLLDEHPHINRDQIRAAIEYAVKAVRRERDYPYPPVAA